MNKTISQYNEIVNICADIFEKKTKDYGTAWRILRPSSLTDQIFIKAQRIRTLQEAGTSKVNEGVEDEFIGVINYCVMGIIQLTVPQSEGLELPADKVVDWYNKEIAETRDLMLAKNHDYGEAWRDMRVSSLTDLILMKILRVKQIEDNEGETIISEGIDANYRDMINYAIFSMIKLKEETLVKS